MISRIALISTLAVAGSTFAQDIPDRNPEQNADGTKTYWTGNNMQWDIQEAIDDANSGDIIVVRAGSYVNQISINKPNITLRPFVDENGDWEVVNIWAPTQGPEAQNGWSLYLGSDTENVYVGEPRQFRELTSGYVAPNTIVRGEYMGDPTDTVEVDNVGGTCFNFWSRSVDNTSIMSDSSKATVQNCYFTSENGFGGACILMGDANDTAFVDCEFDNLYANGTTLRSDVPGLSVDNYCITIYGESGVNGTMEYTFSDCLIQDCRGETIVYQSGGGGTWNETIFDDNEADVNYSGVVTLTGGCNPSFFECNFTDNTSGYGTVFFNGEGTTSVHGVRFVECEFENNITIDNQWGGVIYAIDAKSAAGTAPKVMFDDCNMDGNNGNDDVDQQDFVSPWFPTYRQGDANEDAMGSTDGGVCTPSADLNGDGVVDGADLGIIFAKWGTDGVL
jgi:hypothetical protein